VLWVLPIALTGKNRRRQLLRTTQKPCARREEPRLLPDSRKQKSLRPRAQGRTPILVVRFDRQDFVVRARLNRSSLSGKPDTRLSLILKWPRSGDHPPTGCIGDQAPSRDRVSAGRTSTRSLARPALLLRMSPRAQPQPAQRQHPRRRGVVNSPVPAAPGRTRCYGAWCQKRWLL
jgi:hypothetical protein